MCAAPARLRRIYDDVKGHPDADPFQRTGHSGQVSTIWHDALGISRSAAIELAAASLCVHARTLSETGPAS